MLSCAEALRMRRLDTRERGDAMTAIHLTTPKHRRDWSEESVRTALSRLAGVIRVAAIQSSGLVSVLYDETRATPSQILRAVRQCGIEAQICRRPR